MPVVLFGVESWYLTDTVLDNPECFSAPLVEEFLNCLVFTQTQCTDRPRLA